jgi:SAM-dependent methyltransferase
MSILERMKERYESGDIPWDSESPPPEVAELPALLHPGRALDLGCGYGRASIFLARRGWQVDAIDFVTDAIGEASARASAAGVRDRIRFHVASVTELGFLTASYDFALDVGCMHVLELEERRRYRDGLLRLLRPGANYLLFARIGQDETAEDEENHGVKDEMIRAEFAEGFRLERVEYGVTQMQDNAPWRSGWYWFVRTAESQVQSGQT